MKTPLDALGVAHIPPDQIHTAQFSLAQEGVPMLRRVPRFVRWTVLVAVLGAVSASVFQSWITVPAAAGPKAAPAQSQSGAVSPSDRELLVKVRQAGLWEMPTGQQMQQQASSAQVREVGAILAREHAQLDQIVRDTAAGLGVALPSQPSAQQQGWMTEISAQTGPQYDQVAVNRLRLAHGIVLPVIAQVRVGTRNQVVRDFADTAAAFVTRHIEHLEGTGLVDFAALPEPQLAANPAPAASSGIGDLVVLGLVFLGLVGTVVGLLLIRRGRRREQAPAAAAVVPGPRLAAAEGPRHVAGRHVTSQYPLGGPTGPLLGSHERS